jgi:hypothetical protein
VAGSGCSWSQRDDDGDGLIGANDSCPDTGIDEVVDANGCSWNQRDDDGDGLIGADDSCRDSTMNICFSGAIAQGGKVSLPAIFIWFIIPLAFAVLILFQTRNKYPELSARMNSEQAREEEE